MSALRISGLFVALVFALPVHAAGNPQIIRLTQPQLLGEVFSDPRTIKLQEHSESGATEANDLVLHDSQDRCLQTGIYQTGANRYTIDEPYPHDEFMYFLDGGVTLTAVGEPAVVVGAGNAVLIPKGWRGVWDSAGYRKIYVIYDCTD